jgi:hypothetical protein
MSTSGYTWNDRTNRYHGPDGRIVSRAQVRQAIDDALVRSRADARDVSQRLQRGEISLADWQTQMRTHVKNIHIGSAEAARGGSAEMSPADYGRVGRELRDQYTYLDRFAADIEAGETPLDGRFLTRVDLYSEAGRGTFHAIEKYDMGRDGMTEARRVLGAADHCDGCIAEDMRGWVPIDDVADIGSQECGVRCACDIEYR